MSRLEHHRRMIADEPRRDAAKLAADKTAPEDPLLAMTYWSELRDHAEAQLTAAAAEAKKTNSWTTLGAYYGMRTPQAVQRKFRHLAD